MTRRHVLLPVVLLGALIGWGKEGESRPAWAAQVDLKAGLLVHLGCGDGSLLADLAAAHPALLVQGLTLDEKRLAAARKQVFARHLYGRVSVEQVRGGALPYADHLANFIVVTDAAAVEQAGIGFEEILRALAPRGTLLVADAVHQEAWKARAQAPLVAKAEIAQGCLRIVKARPAHHDEWTHARHDAGQSPVSNDDVSDPPNALQWLVGPVWPALIQEDEPVADGAVENNPYGVLSGGGVYYTLNKKGDLTARDVYNGTFLWQKTVPVFNWRNSLVAGEGRIYGLPTFGPVIGLDARTGEEAIRFEHESFPKEEPKNKGGKTLFVSDGVLVVCARPAVAFDEKTGKVLWTGNAGSVAGGGRIYDCNPRSVVAQDLKSGEAVWEKPAAELAAEGERLSIAFYKNDLLLLYGTYPPSFKDAKDERNYYALSTQDGSLLWKYTTASPRTTTQAYYNDAYYAAGQVWFPNFKLKGKNKKGKDLLGNRVWQGVDPQTGKKTREFESQGDGPGCFLLPATEKWFSIKRPVDFMLWKDGSMVPFGGSRQGCVSGSVASNGLFFGAPHGCWCVTGTIMGWTAFASKPGTLPAYKPFVRREGQFPSHYLVDPQNAKSYPALEGRLEHGPAIGGSLLEAPAPWPTYRGDNARSCATSEALPASFSVLWETQVDDQQHPGGRLGEDWRYNSLDPGALTAPTIGGGMVFVGQVESHRLVALDAASGKAQWTYTTGGRLDTPPTFHKGLCLLGGQDGYVYSIKADDGSLAWRFRAAPYERRVMVFGQPESPWPVVGGVLVEGDAAYVTAGRSSSSDGGIFYYALDPATGKVLAQQEPVNTKFGGWTGVANDLLVCDGKNVSVGGSDVGFELVAGGGGKKTQTLVGSPRHEALAGDSRLMMRSWMRPSWQEPRNWGRFLRMQAQGVSGRLVAFDEGRVVSYRQEEDKPNGKTMMVALWKARPERGTPPVWKHLLPKGHQAEAFLIAGETLYVAGPVEVDAPLKGGFLWSVSMADGKIVQEAKLSAGPVPDGLAAGEGRIYLATRDGKLACFGKK